MPTSTGPTVAEDRAVARTFSGVLAAVLLVGISMPWWTERGHRDPLSGWAQATIWAREESDASVGENVLTLVMLVAPVLALLVLTALLLSASRWPTPRTARRTRAAGGVAALGMVLLFLALAATGNVDLHAGLLVCFLAAACGTAIGGWLARLSPR